jgi:hypothetical protein
MPVNVNCTSYLHEGGCTHQAAPRRLWGMARCIVWLDATGSRKADPREMGPVRCRLCTPYPKPPPPPDVPMRVTTWVPVDGHSVRVANVAPNVINPEWVPADAHEVRTVEGTVNPTDDNSQEPKP